MTFTPLDSAFDSIAAPDPGSSGSTRSTDAPSVMSASACCCIVLALPWALSILKSVNPAVLNACVRNGASYVTYRADVVVSGSNTPTLPFPCAARPFNCDINEKSDVNALTSIFGTAAAGVLPPDPPLDDDPDEPHPAAVATARVATLTTTTPLLRSLISILLSRVPDRDEMAGREDIPGFLHRAITVR